MNRRLVRSVRRAEPDKPGADTANRSITDGCSSTSGAGSSPGGTAQAASRAAAHGSAFARARVGGTAAAAACRAKPAAPAGTDAGHHRAI
jgi:hypothetical protein